MPSRLNETGRRGLVAATLVLVAILVVVDLLRPDSLIRGAWSELFSSRSSLRRFFQTIREEGPGRMLRQ